MKTLSLFLLILASPKEGRLYYRGTGYLASIISITSDGLVALAMVQATSLYNINKPTSLSFFSPKEGRLYYRGTGYLASIISIDPQMGWLHYSGTGYLASGYTINNYPLPYSSSPKTRVGYIIEPSLRWQDFSWRTKKYWLQFFFLGSAYTSL